MKQVFDAAIVRCERRVFHRDIKLENLLLNPETMEVKLIDFGCGATMKKTGYKALAGTREYLPPEFEVDGKYHGGLGMLLFGESPSACDLHKTCAKSHLSRECCQMICDCLRPNPQMRIPLNEMPLHAWFNVASE